MDNQDDPYAAFGVRHDDNAQEADPYAAFGRKVEPRRKRGRQASSDAPVLTVAKPSVLLHPAGQAHDGDTFRLNTGQNGRLYGVDAFELGQQGRKGGQPVPLGLPARDAIIPYLRPDTTITPTGDETYGRPVVSLSAAGRDAGKSILDQGWGLAIPEYLKNDPARLTDYMEAERLARLNRRGANAGQFQSPADFRHGKPDPWAAPQQGQRGNSDAVFFDDPTPFQGLRPDIAAGYLAVTSAPKSTAADIKAYAAKNGFQIDEGDIADFIADRSKAGVTVGPVVYKDLPKLLTDPGDGALGAGVRGLADPINMVDEMGAVVDTMGLTPGRENIWDSDRRFGDILYNNLDQNRSILGHDDANHPYARFAGQLASGIAIPGASTEGVGLAAGRAMLREGGSRFAAEQAAKTAVRSRLGAAGAVEGGLAGFGQGEGGIVDRLPSAGVGAVTGGAFGYGAAALTQTLGPIGRSTIDRLRSRKPAEAAIDQAPGFGVDEAVGAVPSPRMMGIANEAQEGDASISSPRIVDRIDVNDRARPMLSDVTDAQRQAQGQRIAPLDVLPIPSNEVASIDEAANIGKGMYAPVKATNEADELRPRAIPSPVDSTRTLPKRGPLDLMTYLRTRGGLIDHGGELRSMGIDNAGRDLDFAKGEQRFGKLVDPERGMTLDDAALDAWEAGYFPDHATRPTINEFLDALDDTNRGMNRTFRPEDMAEVDAFNAARDQRFAVEKARDEGAPLVVDRSEPATLDDIEANAPPVSAYEEWGENAPDFAGNIRLGNLDSPQNIKRALAVTEQRVGGFDAARRGRIRQAETQALANELNMTPEQLLSRRKGRAFNAEEALAARQILAKSGNELVNMAKAIQRLDDPGEEKLAAFRQAWVRHVAIQEQVAGATAEAGRALAQFRQMADSRFVRGNVLDALAQGGGGKDRLKAAADMILENSDTPQRLNKIAAQTMKPKWIDKINELWINSLLSGPQTHVVNMVSNTMTALAQIPEHAVAAGVGSVRSLGSRQKIADRVLFSELGARAVGLLQGTKEGLRQAVRTLKTGEGSDFANKVEARNQDAISGVKGKVIRAPTRMLSAEDELFKGMARRMELSGLAVRAARAQGLKGEEAKVRAAELLANPTDRMLDQAFDYGRYITFQRPLGEGMSGISRGINAIPGMKFIVPFVRTPTNLLKFSVERSPAAPMLKEWRADFVAGGARRDLAVARAMVGTGVGLLVAEMAANGMITGNGPADKDAKALLRADGWQPYSIKLGEKYISYQRLDPFATTLGVAAGMVDLQEHMTEKQKGDVATLVVASIMQNLANKTWLSGISTLVDAVNEPERYAGNWIERIAGSAAVPAGVAQVARTVDPTLREAEGILDAVRARLPGLSQSLSPRRDVWGKPITGEGGIGPDLVSPIWKSTRRDDPVNNALLDAGVHVSKPNRTIGGVRLSADQWGQYQESAGALGYSGVASLVGSPEWRDMSDDDKQDAVSDIMKAARKDAREIVLQGVRVEAQARSPDLASDPYVAFGQRY